LDGKKVSFRCRRLGKTWRSNSQCQCSEVQSFLGKQFSAPQIVEQRNCVLFYFGCNWEKSNWVHIPVANKQAYICREYIFGM